ncbi:zinc-ribbon domain-containing protein [Ethanoligenens sp.]|uniref:zinc ribbon domain-containing protein n=1 Tax=Ethanoligenens sp. TaxID=2099655 RepID=UPI0039E89B91
MAYCTKCGTMTADGEKFCRHCGNAMEHDLSASTTAAATAASVYRTQAPAQKLLSPNPAINLLKTHGSSGKMLVAAILFSLMVLIKLITAFQGNNLINYIKQILGDNNLGGLSSSLDPFLEPIQQGIVAFNLLLLIPNIFILVGLWLFFNACTDTTNPRINTSGLTLIQVIVIIQLVGICILGAIIEIALIAATAYTGNLANGFGAMEYAQGSIVLLIVAILLVAGIFTLIILYYSAILSTVKSAKHTVQSERVAVPKLAGYLVFVNFAGAVIALIGGAVSGNAAQFFASLLNAVFLVLIALVVSGYKSAVHGI